jgi:hypothetical protein
MTAALRPAAQPVILMLPLPELYVPDWNPRRFVDPSEQEDLEAFMRTWGRVERIVVWKGTGDAPWAIIEGQRRFLAAQKLGWTHLEAEVMDCTQEEAEFRASSSNNKSEPYWLDKYENWESRMRVFKERHPGDKVPSQEEWAAKFGTKQQIISRAMLLLGVLGAPARALIREHLKIPARSKAPEGLGTPSVHTNSVKPGVVAGPSGPEKSKPWRLTEGAALPLGGLWANRKPEEAQDLALRALQLVLAHHWTAAKVASVVREVNAGKAIGDFDPSSKRGQAGVGSPAKAVQEGPGMAVGVLSAGLAGLATKAAAKLGMKGPQAEGQEMGVPGQGVKRQSGPGPLARGPQAEGQEMGVPGQGAKRQSGPDPLARGPQAEGQEMGVPGQGVKRQSGPGQVLGTILSSMSHALGRDLAKGMVWLVILALGWMGFHFLFHSRFRGLGLSTFAPAVVNQPDSQGAGGKGLGSAGGGAVPSGQAAHLSPGPQDGRQDLAAPGRSAGGNGGAQGGPVQESLFVGEFLKKAFAPDPLDPLSWIDYINANTGPEARNYFFNQAFPPEKLDEMYKDKYKESFQLTQPAACLQTGPESDLFRAQGILSVKSNGRLPAGTKAAQPVTLLVGVHHGPDGKLLVASVGLFKEQQSATASSNQPARSDSKPAPPNGAAGGIQYTAPVQAAMVGSTVTGVVTDKAVTVNGPKVLGVQLPGVNLANPLAGLNPFGGSPKPAATPGNSP